MHTLPAMTFTATVHNGAIVLPPGIALPEGALVEVCPFIGIAERRVAW